MRGTKPPFLFPEPHDGVKVSKPVGVCHFRAPPARPTCLGGGRLNSGAGVMAGVAPLLRHGHNQRIELHGKGHGLLIVSNSKHLASANHSDSRLKVAVRLKPCYKRPANPTYYSFGHCLKAEPAVCVTSPIFVSGRGELSSFFSIV